MRHHVVGKIRPLMGSKGGIFFSPSSLYKTNKQKTPNNLLWCLSGAQGWAGSARVFLAAPSRRWHRNLCAGMGSGADPSSAVGHRLSSWVTCTEPVSVVLEPSSHRAVTSLVLILMSSFLPSLWSQCLDFSRHFSPIRILNTLKKHLNANVKPEKRMSNARGALKTWCLCRRVWPQ